MTKLFVSFEVISAGYSVGDMAQIMVDSTVVNMPSGYGRGLNVAVVDETSGALLQTQVYDTSADSKNADAFADFIEQVPIGRLIAIAVKDEATENLTDRARRACEMIGSGLIRNLAYRGSWAIMGVKGTPPGSALEQLDNDAPTSVSIWVPFPHKEAAPRVAFLPVLAGILIYGVLSTAILGYFADRAHGQDAPPPPQPPPADPPAARPYNRYTFLTAHNAMANKADGWPSYAAQQYGSVTEQLAFGVRALALDVYVYDPGTGIDLYLCHGSCTSFGTPRPPRLFSATLTEVVTFLENNLREVVTILIESPGGWNPNQESNDLFIRAFNTSRAMDLIFWPDIRDANPPPGVRTWDVNPADGVFNWPTLDTMINANRRLLLFVDRNTGIPANLFHVVPFVWRYMRETQFSDQDFWRVFSASCEERAQSSSRNRQANRSVMIWDHFPAISAYTAYSETNYYNRLLARAQLCSSSLGLVPNFVQLDFVTTGDGKRLVDNINAFVWAAPDALAALQALPRDIVKDEL